MNEQRQELATSHVESFAEPSGLTGPEQASGRDAGRNGEARYASSRDSNQIESWSPPLRGIAHPVNELPKNTSPLGCSHAFQTENNFQRESTRRFLDRDSLPAEPPEPSVSDDDVKPAEFLRTSIPQTA